MKKDWMIKESELDNDQIKILTAVLDKSCIVSGCAGSGKSVLALHKARRIQNEKGYNYQIVVYTKALCKYMNTGRTELGLNKDFLIYEEWGNRQCCPSADYIIVDEIQDFTKTEIDSFIKAARKHFFFFGDTAQSLYEGLKNRETIPVEDIEQVAKQQNRAISPFELFYNYRLPIAVAKFVQSIGVGLPPVEPAKYKSKETSIPRLIQCSTPEEQISRIQQIIKGLNLTDVAILLPKNQPIMNRFHLCGNVQYVYEELFKKGGNYECKYNDRELKKFPVENLDFTSNNPKIMTYHSAKGLQFETVILPFMEEYDEYFGDSDRKALYVAMTRTYKNLYILYSNRLPYRLSIIDPALYKNTLTDTIEYI